MCWGSPHCWVLPQVGSSTHLVPSNRWDADLAFYCFGRVELMKRKWWNRVAFLPSKKPSDAFKLTMVYPQGPVVGLSQPPVWGLQGSVAPRVRRKV